MSKFNNYARRIDEIARADFSEYRKAEAAFKKAQSESMQFPEPSGIVSAEYATKAARVKANYLEAKENLDRVKKEFISHNDDIANIRKELVGEISNNYAVDPSAIDHDMLVLLESGILRSDEYLKFITDAQKNNNPTMVRLIAQFAVKALDKIKEKYGENNDEVRNIRLVEDAAIRYNGNDIIEAFDYLADVFRRASNNAGMIDHWDELTAAAINEF